MEAKERTYIDADLLIDCINEMIELEKNRSLATDNICVAAIAEGCKCGYERTLGIIEGLISLSKITKH